MNLNIVNSTKEHKYAAIANATKNGDLSLEYQEAELQNYDDRLARRGRSLWQWLLIAVAFICSNAISICIARQHPSDSTCTARTNVWSPALEAISYKEITLQNEFNRSSIYRGPPTPERENAWLELYDHNMISIPPSSLPKMNKSSSIPWMPTPNNTGLETRLEVHHQLHCLDYIRQYTWHEAGAYGPESLNKVPVPVHMKVSDVGRRMHADHCFEALRKSLMCHADVSPMLVIKDEESKIGKVADFDTHMMCRDWENINKWVEGREVEG